MVHGLAREAAAKKILMTIFAPKREKDPLSNHSPREEWLGERRAVS